jgi:hypothetical protein
MKQVITEETLETIESCGAAEMPLDETMEIVGMAEAEWQKHPAAAERYRKGQLRTKLEVRLAVVEGAKGGVPACLKEYKEFAMANEDEDSSRNSREDGAAASEFADI